MGLVPIGERNVRSVRQSIGSIQHHIDRYGQRAVVQDTSSREQKGRTNVAPLPTASRKSDIGPECTRAYNVRAWKKAYRYPVHPDEYIPGGFVISNLHHCRQSRCRSDQTDHPMCTPTPTLEMTSRANEQGFRFPGRVFASGTGSLLEVAACLVSQPG